MNRLNSQDASFLLLETPSSPMHIGFLLTFGMPAGAPDDYMQRLHEKLARFPVDAAPFNQKLAHPDGLGRLAQSWVTDEAVDLDYHLRHEALPWPGGERELGMAISRLHSLPLERSRPLWECTLIEGLEPRRFAVYLKIHHSMADGVGLMEQITRALATSPRGRSVPLWSTPLAEPAPRPTQAADDDWRHFLQGVVADLVKPPAKPRSQSAIPRGPRCLINGPTTSQRRFATQSLPLARVKALAAAAEATVNDVVLALCGGVLRDYLEVYDRVPVVPLIASVPVALPRPKGQIGGNSVASLYALLGTHLRDPRKRLLSIRDAMRDAKAEFNRLPTSLSRTISSVGMLLMMALPKKENTDPNWATFTNLTISNVPGPRQPLYFHGARMDGMYPVSVLAGDHRLNITVLGYCDHLHFGVIGCPRTMPKVQHVATGLPAALQALETAMQRPNARS
ncbi:MAG: wax ester/triacylglycerol synthase family O-acyltransferase [Ideonella sp.]|nr:wax ester/triacylglycerol synthase family O-acyltransferase [Ideonella sp.]